MSTFRKTASAAVRWTRDLIRTFHPFIVCWFAAVLFVISADDASSISRFMGVAISGLSFMWALDMAAARAEAKAKSEMAAMIVANLTSGEDTEIRVSFSGESGSLTVTK